MNHDRSIAELRIAIEAMEAQRPILGDAVVDTALAPLREKLLALETVAGESEQRRQVTIFFADVAGFTELVETMDAERIADLLNDLWSRLDVVIDEHGGWIDKHIGDAVMALWGAETAREDDAERPIFPDVRRQRGGVRG